MYSANAAIRETQEKQEFIELHSKDGPGIPNGRSWLIFPTGARCDLFQDNRQPPPHDRAEYLKIRRWYHAQFMDEAKRIFSAIKMALTGRTMPFTWPNKCILGEAPSYDGKQTLLFLKNIHAKHAAKVEELDEQIAQLPAEIARREKLDAHSQWNQQQALQQARLESEIAPINLED